MSCRSATACLVWLAAGVVHAQTGNDTPGTFTSIGSLWESFRQEAVSRGFQLSVVYDGEGVGNTTGGIRTGAVYLGVLYLPLTIDADRLIGWKGATFFFQGLGAHGGHPSGDLVGDVQGVSSIEAPAGWQLYEAWLQQNLFGNHLSALFGRYDLNTEFHRLQSATLFLNGSFGVGIEFAQSGEGGPSIFPDTSVGARVAFKPIPGVVFRTAVLDGVPVSRLDGSDRIFAKGDGLLLVGEADFLSRPTSPDTPPPAGRLRIGRSSGLAPYERKFAIGGWYYTAEFDDLSERGPDGQPLRHRGSAGGYLLADALVFQGAAAPRQRLNAFVELGFADSRVNRFGFSAYGGLVYSGLIPALGNDELGLGVAAARNGTPYVDMQQENGVAVTRTETTIEATYLMQFGDHWALQPDIEYVMRPGTDPKRRNALVALLRFELSY